MKYYGEEEGEVRTGCYSEPTPTVSECPKCGSSDVTKEGDTVKCNHCGFEWKESDSINK